MGNNPKFQTDLERELYEALAEMVHKTPFLPVDGGITLTLSFDQIKRQRAALRKARGEA